MRARERERETRQISRRRPGRLLLDDADDVEECASRPPPRPCALFPICGRARPRRRVFSPRTRDRQRASTNLAKPSEMEKERVRERERTSNLLPKTSVPLSRPHGRPIRFFLFCELGLISDDDCKSCYEYACTRLLQYHEDCDSGLLMRLDEA